MLTINIKEKKYSDKIVLKDLDLQIHSNGIYGVVGKNGQGKTSFFKCILGLENYEGNCALNNQKIALQDIAWCPAEPIIYEELTTKEFSEFYCKLLNIKNTTTNNLFEVPDDKLIKEFSTGMKKKAYLNAIFQKKYALYILDEPFNGLDIESNYQLMHYLNHLSKESIVLISSHILDVLYTNCKEIYLIDNTTISLFEEQNYNDIQVKLFKKGNNSEKY
jgi:ABC-2 type transport system ATP-binding protein